MAGVVGVVFYGRRELLHAGGRLHHRRGLLFGTRRERMVARGNLLRRVSETPDACAQLAGHAAKPLIHASHRAGEFAKFVMAIDLNLRAQIPPGDALGKRQVQLQRANYLAADGPRDDNAEQNHKRAQDQGKR